MAEGYQIKEANEWERTRTLALFIYNTSAKRPIKDPKKLFKIFTDKLNSEPPLTKEQMQQLIEQAIKDKPE